MNRRRFSIRAKLTIATVLPLFIAIISCSLLGFSILVTKIGSQAQEKVRSDLSAALEIYNNEIEHLHDVVRFTASAPYIAAAVARKQRAAVAGALLPLLKSEKLQIFTAVDASGTVLFRASNPGANGDDLAGDLLIRQALAGKEMSGTTVIPADRLAIEGSDLARQAVVRAIPTPMAKPGQPELEQNGMFLVAATPVRDQAGNVVGALYGGVMLNNNNALVDRIKRVVYEGGRHDGKDLGGATIFLNDLRIATNMLDAAQQRAIGTRLSEEVYNKVVLMKEKWLGRAFVVHDWYFSAYEPLLSLEGVPLGALYVGTLEKPFTRLKFNMILLVIGILLFGALLGTGVARIASSRLAKPIKELESLASRVAAGERGVAINSTTDDEIGDLAEEFNRMSAALTKQEQEIRNLNRGLEQKVLLRTIELEEKNSQLIQTQQELVRVEKLAAIGELAAGVAHEINNPLAVIRGNAELLQMSLAEGAPAQEEIGIITRQVGRVERIVANLLKFARQEQPVVGLTPINNILDEIIAQVGHQIPLSCISIERRYTEGELSIVADADQLRQVFTNLILNGVQAMPNGGTLTIASSVDQGRESCAIVVSDTGTGILPENLALIFNPFFTTRNNGTGLGLSVSYGIIRAHGGEILVESSPGEGTSFRVILPLKLL